MSIFKKAVSLAVCLALAAQTAMIAFADTSADEEQTTDDPESIVSQSEDVEIADYVFEGYTLPCSENDPAYYKYYYNSLSSTISKAVSGASSLTHLSQFSDCDKVYGIDVSYYQGTIDWDKVKAAGIDYVIIRVGYRGYGNGKLVLDDNFKTNIKGAQAAGLDVGVYFYTQAISTTEAKEEANFVLKYISSYDLDLPVYFDIENVDYDTGRLDSANLSKSELTSLCTTFCKTIVAGGYKAGVYANKYWLTDKLNSSTIAKSYPIWLAQYATKATYTGTFDMWQYSSTGTVSGISGYVDMDVRYVEPTAPDAPSSLTVSSYTSTTATLKWSAVSGCDGYKVYRYNTSTKQKALVATTSKTSYTITLPSSTRDYYVVAYKAGSDEDYVSDESPHVTLSKSMVKNVRVTARSQTTITLAWDAVTDAAGYEVWSYDTDDSKYKLVKRVTATTCKVQGLGIGTIANFKIKPYFNADGTTAFVSGTSTKGAASTAFKTGTYTGKTHNVTLSANTSSSITLTWTANSYKHDGYQIFMYDLDTGTRSVVGTTSSTSYTVTGLSKGQRCKFCVRAYYNRCGKKIPGLSSEAIYCTNTLSAPSNFNITTDTKSSCTLTWGKVSGATGYNIYEVVSGKATLVKSTTSVKATISGLTKGSSHKYFVVPYKKSSGQKYEGVASSKLTIKIAAVAPTNVCVKAYNTTAVKLGWDTVVGATKYQVYLYDKTAGEYKLAGTTTSTSYTIRSLSENTNYKARIKTVYGTTEGIWSSYKVFSTKPATPTSLKVTATTNYTITLSWSKVSGATGYRIYVYDAAKGKFVKRTDVGNVTSCTVSNLVKGRRYKFRIRAIKNIDDDYYYSPPTSTLVTKTSGAKYYKKTSSSATTITEGLSYIGITSSYELRYRIAIANCIGNYTGTSSQNATMLKMLKNGTLLIPQ
ncbi:MAG: fibronectin type III domain-containing protein [Ruminococcus sp.]|nr:fibronectin type III domain-containing protein [Ruminococcus sp.]